jgi:hypothetical protein
MPAVNSSHAHCQSPKQPAAKRRTSLRRFDTSAVCAPRVIHGGHPEQDASLKDAHPAGSGVAFMPSKSVEAPASD